MQRQYECKQCVVKYEQDAMHLAISEAIDTTEFQCIFESGIIAHISSYAVGIIVQCAKSERCDAQISISNRYDVENSLSTVDSDGNTIMVSSPKQSPFEVVSASDDMNQHHPNVYGNRRDIVCSECVKQSATKGIMAATPTMLLMHTQSLRVDVYEDFNYEDLSDCDDEEP